VHDEGGVQDAWVSCGGGVVRGSTVEDGCMMRAAFGGAWVSFLSRRLVRSSITRVITTTMARAMLATSRYGLGADCDELCLDYRTHTHTQHHLSVHGPSSASLVTAPCTSPCSWCPRTASPLVVDTALSRALVPHPLFFAPGVQLPRHRTFSATSSSSCCCYSTAPTTTSVY
jgi:hypothetical protein